MKIAVITSLFAKWYMYINARQLFKLRLQFGGFYWRYQIVRLLFCVLLGVFANNSHAQKFISFRFEPKPAFIKKQITVEKLHGDSVYNLNLLNKLNILHANGFFLAEPNYTLKTDTLFCEIKTNHQFKYILVKDNFSDNIDGELLRFGSKQNQLFNLNSFNKYFIQQLNYYQNNGYPFAQFKFDSVIVDTQIISFKIKVNKGPLTYFDSVNYAGTASIKTKFLQKYLSIKPNSLYNEALIASSTKKLSGLPFIQVATSPAIYFYGNKAKPFFYLNNKPANTFNAVIGFAPNSAINNKLVVTGDADLNLQNILGSGKSFAFNYRSFLNNSQDLNLNLVWPYFANTNLGVDYSFRLLKFDSLYTDLTNNIGVQYILGANNYLKLFYQQQNVFTINADTNFVKQNKLLPNFNDVKNNLYGLGLKLNQLNYVPNPQKGYVVNTEIGVGVKKIIKNAQVNQVRLQNLNGNEYSIYDSINLSSLQFRFNLNGSYYVTVYNNFVLHNQVIAAFVDAPNLFINELYRIGGLKTLRGFDEQSIFANKFAIYNVELRYLLNRNSNFLVFYNQAWYANTVRIPTLTDNPKGFGFGLNLQTGGGVFSLFYAIGKQRNNTFNFNEAKIHFGYINYF